MAKTTAPLLSFGGSGQVGKAIVFSKWKGRPYVRQLVTPSNPNTTGQQSTRNAFSTANAIWKIAPTEFTAPWEAFAAGQVLTARNAFVGQFVAACRGQADLDLMPFSPGALAGPAPLSVTATPGSSQLSVAIVTPTPPTGWTLAGVVAAAILDQDPEAPTDLTMTAQQEATSPAVVTGLTPSVEYQVGGWPIWTRPDGRTAYGPSLNDQATPTA